MACRDGLVEPEASFSSTARPQPTISTSNAISETLRKQQNHKVRHSFLKPQFVFGLAVQGLAQIHIFCTLTGQLPTKIIVFNHVWADSLLWTLRIFNIIFFALRAFLLVFLISRGGGMCYIHPFLYWFHNNLPYNSKQISPDNRGNKKVFLLYTS